jgi:hypothetical protein
MNAEKFTEEIKTRVKPSMKSDFDLLCEAEGKKDAELSREIFRKYLLERSDELAVLREQYDVRQPSIQPASSVSYCKTKSKTTKKPTKNK